MCDDSFLGEMRAINRRVCTPRYSVDRFRGKKISEMSKEELFEVVRWLGMAHARALEKT